MRLPSSFLFFLLVTAPITTSATPSHAIKRIHNLALKHSAGFARNLRLALKPVLVAQSDGEQKKFYCIHKPNSQAGGAASGGTSNGTFSSIPTSTGIRTSTAGTSATSTRTPANPNPTQAPASRFRLVEKHEGKNFFNGWDFFTAPDPTHGMVQFLDQGSGRSAGLVDVNDEGNAIMRVETTPQVTGNRQSIRITTQSQFDGGLFLMDSVHMPTGCGVWPAWWSNGPNWPIGGEIDILEGVNDYTNNQATLHTNPGCSLSSTDPDALKIAGNVITGANCAAGETGNQGCGVRSKDRNSFGPGFNKNGGGVYAMQWDENGIEVYFFPRANIPSDIEDGAPEPNNWGTPLARWAAASCDPFKFFFQHSFIFDTTLCGDWAGSVWSSSGIPGQEESCAQRTGVPTCEAYVRANGGALKEAYWEIKSVKMYQKK